MGNSHLGKLESTCNWELQYGIPASLANRTKMIFMFLDFIFLQPTIGTGAEEMQNWNTMRCCFFFFLRD